LFIIYATFVSFILRRCHFRFDYFSYADAVRSALRYARVAQREAASTQRYAARMLRGMRMAAALRCRVMLVPRRSASAMMRAHAFLPLFSQRAAPPMRTMLLFSRHASAPPCHDDVACLRATCSTAATHAQRADGAKTRRCRCRMLMPRRFIYDAPPIFGDAASRSLCQFFLMPRLFLMPLFHFRLGYL